MVLDVVFSLVGSVIRLFSSIIPPLPGSLSSFVAGLQPRLVSLVQNLPYGNLLPWSTLATACILLPTVYASAVAIRLVRRVFAWLRSRGTSDE